MFRKSIIFFSILDKRKKYNFGKLDKREKLEWKASLTERMIEISQYSWTYWQNLGKEKGIETINCNQITFSPNDYVFSKDEKVVVFRFNSQNGRIIGIKGRGCSVYYVIGIDTDYSAYNHVKWYYYYFLLEI